ncbi:MAG: elongation factor G [Clostridia bacterium]|nr:elongation factor G [Clostridia bacterium]
MAKIPTDKIRNVALLGHGGSGKTSLAEAMLYVSGAVDRLGKTSDGNTVCDYDPEEQKRGFSISTALAPVSWKDIKINILDTPGYLDFVGEVAQALRVAGLAVITVDGKAGIEVGTELAWNYASDAGLPKAFFVNKFDDPEARFKRVLNQLHDAYGTAVCPITVPAVENGQVSGFLDLMDMKVYNYDNKGNYTAKDIPAEFAEDAEYFRNMLLEAVAGTDEELMMKFFEGEEITRDEAVKALHHGIMKGEIVPVFCGSAGKLWGVRNLLDTIVGSFPTFLARVNEKAADGSAIKIEENGDTALFVFKTVADPFVGKMSFFKVMNGTVKRDMILKNINSGAQEKMSHIYVMKGKNQTEVDELACGDIGMIAKLSNTNTNDTLTSGKEVSYAPTVYPRPYMEMAIKPLAKGDEDKISQGITKLLEEDRTLKYTNNPETKQMTIRGIADMHLDVVVSKLKTRFGTSVKLETPKIPYRETIKKTVEVEGKHKKQSGGHGQYGHVRIKFSPGEAEGLTFTESVFGGVVPKNFFPAVEKGLLEAMQTGVAGYPMVNLAANLYDGSYHPVDSNELSFKVAASLAYKKCLELANPVLLEPVGELKVTVPESMVGDVMGDLNKRRGRVMGMTPAERKGYTVVDAEAPKSEMLEYPISLRAMTQGRGSYEYHFVRYEEVPAATAQKIVEAYKKSQEESK